MAKVNAFDDATTADIIAIVRQWRSGMLGQQNMQAGLYVSSEETPVYVTNDSGEEIPAYACMQVTGTEEIGDQNFLVVDKPADITGASGPYLFNSDRAIATDTEGVAQSGRVLRAFVNTGSLAAGDGCDPVVNQWYVATATSGRFVACGGDDVASNVHRIVYATSEAAIAHFVTPGGGIAARSGATLGSATCTLLSIAGGTRSTTATTATVYNDFTSAVGGSVDIVAAKIDGVWSVLSEDCA